MEGSGAKVTDKPSEAEVVGKGLELGMMVEVRVEADEEDEEAEEVRRMLGELRVDVSGGRASETEEAGIDSGACGR